MPRDNRCMYMTHVYFYVCRSDCVGVCWKVCCVAAVVKDSVFSLGVLKYVVCLCKACDGYCVFCLYCDAWSCRCSCMGSVSVSSCRCCMFVSCVHPVAHSQCCILHDFQFVQMPSQIPCGSAIKTIHVHYGSFLLFLSQILQGFEVGPPISISRSCFSQLSTCRDSKDFPVFSPTIRYLGNLIIIVRTHSDGGLCSTWIRNSSLQIGSEME